MPPLGRREVRLPDGLRLSSLAGGNPHGPPVLLLHGLGEQAETWETVSAALAPRFSVLALDLRGHGQSDRPGSYSYEAMRDDVVAVLEVLDLRDVVLVGHSMGGVVAYLVAVARPERVARLVVEDAPMPFPREFVVRHRPSGELPFDWAVVPAIGRQTSDPVRRWWPLLERIAAPTLLIGGGPSSTIPQEEIAAVARLVPDCTLVTIPAGHDVHSAEPEAFTQTVLAWLGAAP